MEGIEFPELTVTTTSGRPLLRSMNVPACNGPIALRDTEAVHRDIDNLKSSVQDAEPADVFMTAASPGVIATFLANDYYETQEEYLYALADAMKPEYDAIAAAGLVLQLDCPDLAMTRAMLGNDVLTDEEFRDQIRLHVRALNHAVRDIPPEQMRMHVCWGNSERPHITDIPMAAIVDVVLEARPAGCRSRRPTRGTPTSGRCGRTCGCPTARSLIPGVLDSTTNFVEHPELVAQRILKFAEVAGKENIIAGTDCGFGTFAGYYAVKPRITWLKLAAMAEGAEMATRHLWKRGL